MSGPYERLLNGKGARVCTAGALTTVTLLLLLAPASGANPAARSQDDSTTTTVDDSPVPTILSSTTSTEATAPSTTADEVSSTTERSTNTTRSASGGGVSTTIDVNAPGGANLLIPGDGTEGAESTTPTVGSTRISDSGPSDGTLIALVIVGLVVIAGAMITLTWRYWVATRPPLRDPDEVTAAE